MSSFLGGVLAAAGRAAGLADGCAVGTAAAGAAVGLAVGLAVGRAVGDQGQARGAADGRRLTAYGPLAGPQGIQASFDWQAAKGTRPARMCTAVLVNTVTGY